MRSSAPTWRSRSFSRLWVLDRREEFQPRAFAELSYGSCHDCGITPSCRDNQTGVGLRGFVIRGTQAYCQRAACDGFDDGLVCEIRGAEVDVERTVLARVAGRPTLGPPPVPGPIPPHTPHFTPRQLAPETSGQLPRYRRLADKSPPSLQLCATFSRIEGKRANGARRYRAPLYEAHGDLLVGR